MGMTHGSPSKSPTKKGAQASAGDKSAGTGDEKGLSSPTSVSMQNSFIIKNADESFDQYFQQMKRRRHMATSFHESHVQASPGGGLPSESHNHQQGPRTTFQRGRRPNARDGHSANVDKFGFLFLFGGDRHQMPFNDLFLIKLPQAAAK